MCIILLRLHPLPMEVLMVIIGLMMILDGVSKLSPQVDIDSGDHLCLSCFLSLILMMDYRLVDIST